MDVCASDNDGNHQGAAGAMIPLNTFIKRY